MAEVLLFHHAQGLTRGCLSFADRLRAAGHVVHAPDLYDGKVFTDFTDGVRYAEEVGFDTIIERGRLAADSLPDGIVYAGFSLGVLPAQMLAQTRPGAKGALLFHGCVPTSEFGRPWPQGVPLQIHMMDADKWVVEDGDLDVARHLDETIESAELFLYPGDRHLFADDSLPRLRRKRRGSAHGTRAQLPRGLIAFELLSPPPSPGPIHPAAPGGRLPG
jgi:dienelactone hydrolase